MRYTEVLDIREIPEVYSNHKTRLLYIHLCLACGFGDKNRGRLITTYTRLAADVGMSKSAVRWSLSRLSKYMLVSVQTIQSQYSRQLCIYVAKKVNKKGKLLS